MKTKTLITTLAIAGLALAGCSGTGSAEAGGKNIQPLFPDQDYIDEADVDDDFDPMDGMGTMEPGEYEVYSMDGAHITFDLPANPEDEALQEIEHYRQGDRKSTRLNSSHVAIS